MIPLIHSSCNEDRRRWATSIQ